MLQHLTVRSGALSSVMIGAVGSAGLREVCVSADVSSTPPGRQVQAQRFAAQLLTGDLARSPVEVAERLLAVQGQDPRGARLAIRARTTGLTAADVDRALTADRSLLITWVNRGTLHVIRSEDYWWLHPLAVRPHLQGVRRLLARTGVAEGAADKGVAVIQAALAADGPLTRDQLASRIAAAGLPSSDNIPLHLLALASMRGIAVRGPMIGTQHAYVHVRDWLGQPPPAMEQDVALGQLARRYLAGHGPASDRDLAKWAGLPLGQVRRGLAAIARELRDRPDGLAELTAQRRHQEVGLPQPRLLGAFDPVLLGWASREPILGDHQGIVTVNGLFRPFALVAGRAAGTWAWAGGHVTLDRFAELDEHVQSALAAEASDVQRFLAAKAGLTEDHELAGNRDETA
jgi:hypothetical protein